MDSNALRTSGLESSQAPENARRVCKGVNESQQHASLGDSSYAKNNRLNEQTLQGDWISITKKAEASGEAKSGQMAQVVAKRGITGTPKLLPKEVPKCGGAAPSNPESVRSFAQLQLKIERLIKGYEDKIEHLNDSNERLFMMGSMEF